MFGPFFVPNSSNTCCLCGATENLTGEHKVKRTALANEFGQATMLIGTFGRTGAKPKYAQSAKSEKFHFSSKLCASCNGSRTQPSDYEFDQLHTIARDLIQADSDPSDAMFTERYQVGTDSYLNVFRYFAKLLCCHMAEVGAPRSVRLSRFAVGETHENCVWLKITRDWTFEQFFKEIDDFQYAAHGGLVVHGNKSNGAPTAFHSTLTLGPLQYVFWSQLTWAEQLYLRFFHRDFFEWCQAQVAQAQANPVSEYERRRLGL